MTEDQEIVASQALAEAKKAAGVCAIAVELGIKHPAVSGWRFTPPGRVLAVERISGIPRWRLRPDLYPAPDGEVAA